MGNSLSCVSRPRLVKKKKTRYYPITPKLKENVPYYMEGWEEWCYKEQSNY